ncbi:hypothetical protein PS3A_29750 [Pseudomonas sp. 3A(2025)]
MAVAAGHLNTWRARHRSLSAAGLLLWFGLLAQAPALAADQPEILLYRYIDNRGVTVMDRQGVPAEYIGKGYQVLNSRGRVVQTVPPAPTAQELRQAEALKAQASADAQLLQQYRSLDEVERARVRRLAELDALIGVAQGNIQGLSAQQASLQSQAADQERAGKPVPQSLLDQLKDLRDQQLGLQATIARHQQARQEAEAGFAQDRLRVQKLLQ